MKKVSAKEAALQDIKDELRKKGMKFIPFRSELNPIMREITRTHILMMTRKGVSHE